MDEDILLKLENVEICREENRVLQVLVLRDTDLARRGTYHGLQPHQDEAEGYPLFA